MSLRKWFAREILALLVMTIIATLISVTPARDEKISYYEFLNLLKENNVSEISYYEDGKIARIYNSLEKKYYEVGIVSNEKFENDVYEYSINNEKFQYSNYVPTPSINYGVLLIFLLVSNIIFRIIWRVVDEKFSSKKMTPEEQKNFDKRIKSLININGSDSNDISKMAINSEIKFSDVIGLDKQIDEIQDIVKFLREPEAYETIGAELPKGILLYGKPGVGKTYIAKAIAGEANVPFYETSASEMQSKYLGESESKIRSLFEKAQKNSPSIIYIDEIDSIATQRYGEHSNKYAASIVNQLLACMDGFSSNSHVIVIAATNHIDTLDRAILRSGRFDRKIYIHEPDKEARKKLLEYYSQNKVLDEKVDFDKLVDITPGFTGADIKTILNEAALLAVRLGKKCISQSVIMEAFRKIAIGSENTKAPPSKEEMRKTAVHEAGHAIVSKHFGLEVNEISIIARGNAAGYNLGGEEENNNFDFEHLKHRVMGLLAGRAAEEIIYNDPSAGASDDLKRASSMIESMVLRFSMYNDQNISMVLTDDRELNEVKAQKAFDEMNAIMQDCYKETINLLKSKIDLLYSLTQALMQKETLTKVEIEKILG